MPSFGPACPTCPPSKQRACSSVLIEVGCNTRHEQYRMCRTLILASSSTTLKDQINSWRGKGEPFVHVQWEGPSLFPSYQHWLRTKEILPAAQSRECTNKESGGVYIRLINCWLLGNALQDELFQDMVISAFLDRLKASPSDIQGFSTGPHRSFLNGPWKRCALGSPIRNLILDLFARFGKLEMVEKMTSDNSFPSDFVRDLLVAMARERDRLSSNPQKRRKRVSFSLPPVLKKEEPADNTASTQVESDLKGFGDDECVYHLHQKSGKQCWRKDVQ